MNLFQYPVGTLHRHPKHGIGYVVAVIKTDTMFGDGLPFYDVEYIKHVWQGKRHTNYDDTACYATYVAQGVYEIVRVAYDHDKFQPLEAANDTR